MAGAMRKMAVYLGLVEEEADLRDGDYADGSYGSRDHGAQPVREPVRAHARAGEDRPRGEGRTSTLERVETRPAPRVAAGSGSYAAPVAVAAERTARAYRREEVAERAPQPLATAAAEPYRIRTIHPRAYNDARQIGEEYREGVPVIMNLTEMSDADAKRIVDFAAGLVFGLQGNIERVTKKVFLLSPVNVDVRAEAAAQLAQDDFFNQS